MNQNQREHYQHSGSTGSTQLTPPATTTGHPNHPNASADEVPFINPQQIFIDPSKAHTQPYLYSSRPFPTHTPPSIPSSSASTPSHTTVTPSPTLSTGTSSTRRSSPQPPSARSTPTPRGATRSVPSKRARKYTPSPLSLPPLQLPVPSPQPLPTEASMERPTKRRRVGAGHTNTPTPHTASFPPPSPPSQSPGVVAAPHEPKPKPKKAPLHPLAVDYGRPMTPVVPRPPFCISSLRGSRIPLSPYPEIPGPEHSLEDELRGPVDPATAEEFRELMRMQQDRVWSREGGFADPFLTNPAPVLDTRSLSVPDGATPTQPRSETTALYGPPPRNNKSVYLGEKERRADSDATTVVNDGFEGVLDLYLGAVQGSTLSGELEFVVGDGVGLTSVGWGDVSSLEISIRGGPSAPSSSGEPQESRIRTVGEYKRVVEGEVAFSSLEPVVPKKGPPFGIEWSYSCCGYATGRVVNLQKAKARR